MTDGQLLEAFVKRRDEAAFASLMNLHGPMVLGICRRVLRDHHDAEEAFQATFLILSRKAASIMHRNHVGSWLYSVAYRTALHFQRLKNKRRIHEIQDSNSLEPVVAPQQAWREIVPLLDRELNSLPEKYRVPLILCDLEGRTHKDVAIELGCPEGTLSGRLMRARNLLAKRLKLCGISLSVGALTVLITQNAAAAAVPASVMLPVIQAAQLSALQSSVASGAISPHVAAVTEGVMKTMFATTIKQVAAGMLLLAGIGFGATELLQQSLAMQPNEDVVVVQTADDQTFHYAGTVVDEQGHAVEGAKIWLDYYRRETSFSVDPVGNPAEMVKSDADGERNREATAAPLPVAITDSRGQFKLSQKLRDFADAGLPPSRMLAIGVIATKEGHGLAAGAPFLLTAGAPFLFETTEMLIGVKATPTQKPDQIILSQGPPNILKLVADDVPIRGRILDTNESPVAGAKIETVGVYGGPESSMATWTAAAEQSGAIWNSVGIVFQKLIGGYPYASNVPGVPAIKSDADGYFTIRGLGRERIAQIVVSGPGIATTMLHVRTTPGNVIKLAKRDDINVGHEVYYPNDFAVKIGPSIPIEGSVTDSQTGKPLADVIVRAESDKSYMMFPSTCLIRTVSDAEGRYRLLGLPMGENFFQLLLPPGAQCKDRFFSVKTQLDSKPVVQLASEPSFPKVILSSTGQPSDDKTNGATVFFEEISTGYDRLGERQTLHNQTINVGDKTNNAAPLSLVAMVGNDGGLQLVDGATLSNHRGNAGIGMIAVDPTNPTTRGVPNNRGNAAAPNRTSLIFIFGNIILLGVILLIVMVRRLRSK